MRFPAGIGQYVPADSWVHRTNPLAKMGVVAAFAVAVFLLEGFAGLAAAGTGVALLIAAARVPWRAAFRGIRPLALLLAITFVAHAIERAPVGGGAGLSLGPVAVTGEGALDGLFFAVRIVLLVVGTSLLTLTTSPIDLADSLEKAMRPLERVGFPAHDVAMMLTVAIRFIPATAEEAERIVTAQVARGARLGEGGPVRRVRSYVPVLVPLFVALFRRADDLAVAMDARCYRGGRGRTRMKENRMRPADWIVLAAGVALLAALAVAL